MLTIIETMKEPAQTYVQAMKDAEGKDGVLSVSLTHGFPWADVPHNRVSVCVTGDAERGDGAREVAVRLADEFWARRREFGFTTEANPVDEALRRASEAYGRPVVVADAGDNPTAGASEDAS